MAVAAPVIQAEMDDWVRLGGGNSGIVGNGAHVYGFHRSAREVPATDYSRRRDPNGSDGPFTNWDYACAGDFHHGGKESLRALHRQALARLMANDPALSMICEFIGKPWADRPVMYWARWEGVTNLRKYTGSGHDMWSHFSWYRSRANQRPHLWTTGVNMTEMFPRHGEDHDGVGYLQYQLENLGYDVGTVDNDYGDKTAAALAKFVKAYNGKVVDGKRVTPAIKIYLDASWSRKFGKDAPDLKPILDRLAKAEAALKALPAGGSGGGLVLPASVTLSGPGISITGTLAPKPAAG